MKNNKIRDPDPPRLRPLDWAFIRQLSALFSAHDHEFSNFRILSLVGPRRNNFQSHVCRRLDDSSLRVLKSFSLLSQPATWRLVAHELIVPLLVESVHVVKFRSVFIHHQVSLR